MSIDDTPYFGHARDSFVDQIVSTRKHLVYQVKASTFSGKKAFYMLMVHPGQEEAFLRDSKTERASLCLADYGEVLVSCYGHQPTDFVKQFVQEHYDFSLED